MFRSSFVALALVATAASAGGFGCGGAVSATAEPPVTSEAATTRAPLATTVQGPARLFVEALGDVPLTASQRTAVEQLAAAADARHATLRAARQDLVLTLAAQVEAGAIDRAALGPKLDAVAAAMRVAQPADRAALEQLHAVLTPDQRAAFVDAVTARMHREPRREASERSPTEGPPTPGAWKDRGPMGMAKWADELQLTDEQRTQLRAAVMQRMQEPREPGARAERDERADFRGAKHEGQAVMAAFKQESFVLDQVAPPRDVGPMVSRGIERMVALAEVALPILTPAQRSLAAQRLRQRAASPVGDGPGGL